MKCSFLSTTLSFTLANIPLERQKTIPLPHRFSCYLTLLQLPVLSVYSDFYLNGTLMILLQRGMRAALPLWDTTCKNCSGYKVQYKCKISLALLLCKYSMVNKKYSFSLMKQLLFVTYMMLKQPPFHPISYRSGNPCYPNNWGLFGNKTLVQGTGKKNGIPFILAHQLEFWDDVI